MGWYDENKGWAVPAAQAVGSWYSGKMEGDENKKRLDAMASDPAAQGYNQAQLAELASMGGINPGMLYQQQQALVDPLKQKGEADMLRKLYAKGMLGLATDQAAGADPLTGQTQTWQAGQRANPMMAAYYAARAGQESKDAYDAIGKADTLRTNAAQRAAALGQAQNRAMLNRQMTQPKTGGGMAGMLQGALGLLGNKGFMKGVDKIFGGGAAPGGMPQPHVLTPQYAAMGDNGMLSSLANFDMNPYLNFNFDDLFGAGIDYGFNSGWDVGGGINWSGDFE